MPWAAPPKSLLLAGSLPPTPQQAAALHAALYQGAGYVGHMWRALDSVVVDGERSQPPHAGTYDAGSGVSTKSHGLMLGFVHGEL
jgi:hypothetical protein